MDYHTATKNIHRARARYQNTGIAGDSSIESIEASINTKASKATLARLVESGHMIRSTSAYHYIDLTRK